MSVEKELKKTSERKWDQRGLLEIRMKRGESENSSAEKSCLKLLRSSEARVSKRDIREIKKVSMNVLL